MLRFFGGKTADATAFPTPARDFLHSELWEPHYPGAMQPGVYSSRFPLLNDTRHNVYTVVNRGGANLTGQQLWLESPLPEDAVVYDCYRGVELKTETPSVDPPTPADVPKGYNLYDGLNAYSGHGATDIDTDPVTGLSVQQCAARCDADAQCDCVTFQSGSCWKRAACAPEGFEAGGYQVYKKRSGYTTWSSRNAYDGNGGTDIDQDPAQGLTATQ